VAGISRFLSRVYRLVTKYADVASDEKPVESAAGLALLRKLHQTIAKITQDFEGRWHFNTSISAIMILVNEITAKESAIDAGEVEKQAVFAALVGLTSMLAPFTPYLAAELWERMGYEGAVFRSAWPVADPELAREDEIEIPVQVNGKLVNVVSVPAGSDEAVMKEAATADAKVVARVEGKNVVKVIVVPGKLVNLVVK
jgi:leucyl-tRNA synthetase